MLGRMLRNEVNDLDYKDQRAYKKIKKKEHSLKSNLRSVSLKIRYPTSKCETVCQPQYNVKNIEAVSAYLG